MRPSVECGTPARLPRVALARPEPPHWGWSSGPPIPKLLHCGVELAYPDRHALERVAPDPDQERERKGGGGFWREVENANNDHTSEGGDCAARGQRSGSCLRASRYVTI